MKITRIPAVLALGLLAACASPEASIKDNPSAWSSLPPDQQALVKKGEIGLGMPESAVRLALGKPDRVTEHTDASGTQKIWHYTEVDTYGDPAFGYPWYVYPYRRYYYDPFFNPAYYAPAQTETDRLRVVFKDGKVSAIERES
jgi:hypothetical protein